jgi:hypothetical protein
MSILINGLVKDIENINNPEPNIPMLYEEDIHLKNAKSVIRAIFACIYCILEKINNENNTEKCYKNLLENTTQEIVNYRDSLNVLIDTFNLSNSLIRDTPNVTISNNIDENKYKFGSTSISPSISSSSSNTSRSSSTISSSNSNTSRSSSDISSITTNSLRRSPSSL